MSILIENTQVFGWEAAIRGARNPMNSWEKSDSSICYGSSRQKDLCNQCVYSYDVHGPWNCDFFIGLPEKSTYIIGPNDHKLLMNLCKGGTEEAKWRRMIHVQMDVTAPLYWWKEFETYVEDYGLQAKKDIWYQMIQLLPTSYNQKRTIDLNYEVLASQYRQRKDHKLDEWRQYCDWIKTLPYSEFITMEDDNSIKIPTLTREDVELLRPKYEDFRKSVMDGIIPVNKEVSDWMNKIDAIIEEYDRITMEE